MIEFEENVFYKYKVNAGSDIIFKVYDYENTSNPENFKINNFKKRMPFILNGRGASDYYATTFISGNLVYDCTFQFVVDNSRGDGIVYVSIDSIVNGNRTSTDLRFLGTSDFIGKNNYWWFGCSKENNLLHISFSIEDAPRIYFTTGITNFFAYSLGMIDDRILDITDNPIGPDAETGGGDGDFDDESDEIPVPDIPSLNISEMGMTSLYEVSITQLNLLAQKLYSKNFFDVAEKFLFGDLQNGIVSLMYYPVAIDRLQTQSATIAFMGRETTVNARLVKSQFIRYDMGTLTLNEYFGSYLDYLSNTEVALYLPFLGVVNLDVNHVMGAEVTITYTLDLYTSTCVVHIACKKGNLNSVLYEYATSLALKLPVNGLDYSQLFSTILNIGASALVGGIAKGAGSVAGAVSEGVQSGANVLSSMKPTLKQSGGIGGASGYMSTLYPYFIIQRPIQHRPAEYNNFIGYTSELLYTLSELKGFGLTIMKEVFIDNFTGTEEEKNLLYSQLKEGVIL